MKCDGVKPTCGRCARLGYECVESAPSRRGKRSGAFYRKMHARAAEAAAAENVKRPRYEPVETEMRFPQPDACERSSRGFRVPQPDVPAIPQPDASERSSQPDVPAVPQVLVRERYAGLETCKYTGVYPQSLSTWKASITEGSKTVHIGCFKTDVEAARAYDAHARRIGRLDNLNFPTLDEEGQPIKPTAAAFFL